MLRIRFFRIGKKHQPSFKIIVTDRRRPPRGGRFVEEVGFWNPLTKSKSLKKERIEYWLSKGAKPSDSVYNLLIKEKVLKGKKIPVHKKGKKKSSEEIKETETEKIKAETAAAGEEKTEKEPKSEKESLPVEIKKEGKPALVPEKVLEEEGTKEEVKPEKDLKKEENEEKEMKEKDMKKEKREEQKSEEGLT